MLLEERCYSALDFTNVSKLKLIKIDVKQRL